MNVFRPICVVYAKKYTNMHIIIAIILIEFECD